MTKNSIRHQIARNLALETKLTGLSLAVISNNTNVLADMLLDLTFGENETGCIGFDHPDLGRVMVRRTSDETEVYIS